MDPSACLTGFTASSFAFTVPPAPGSCTSTLKVSTSSCPCWSNPKPVGNDPAASTTDPPTSVGKLLTSRTVSVVSSKYFLSGEPWTNGTETRSEEHKPEVQALRH